MTNILSRRFTLCDGTVKKGAGGRRGREGAIERGSKKFNRPHKRHVYILTGTIH